MSEWVQVEQETFIKLLATVNDKDKRILEYIHTHRICKLSAMFDQFSDRCESLIDFIALIGGINGKIFSKHSCAIYPKQPAHTLKDSAYSLGFMC
jgi:hypothetical protein